MFNMSILKTLLKIKEEHFYPLFTMFYLQPFYFSTMEYFQTIIDTYYVSLITAICGIFVVINSVFLTIKKYTSIINI